MSLSDFPPELLRGIFNGRNSWAVLELWKAGDRTLNSKFVNSGITDMDLVDNRADSTSRWPKCLTSFKLERLSIVRPNGPFYPSNALRGELQQLHSGLKTLQLAVAGIEEVVLPPMDPPESYALSNNENDDNDEPPSPKRSKALDSADSTDLQQPHQTLWDLNLTWPSLERLELGPAEPSLSYERPKHGSRALSLLPRTLTWLKLASCLEPTLGLMPAGLKTLHLPFESLSADDLRHLPKSITQLAEGSVDEEGLILICEEADLLPNLIAFPLDGDRDAPCDVYGFVDDLHNENGIPWPPSLRKMSRYIDAFYLDRVPHALTSLSYQPYECDSPVITAVSIEDLPRGLTYLNAFEFEWQAMRSSDECPRWPSALTILETCSNASFDLDCFRLLPRSLTSFTLNSIDPSELGGLDFEEMCALGRDSLLADSERWSSLKQDLPQMVENLLKRGKSLPQQSSLDTYIESIESGRLFGLPLGLTSLNLMGYQEATELQLLFPPKLTSLQTVPSADFGDSKVFGALPPTSLVDVVIGYPFSSENAESLTTSALYNASTITSLTIHGYGDLPVSLFKILPRTLLNLDIIVVPSVTTCSVNARALEDLPPNLKTIRFAGTLDDGLHAWVHYLPRTLHVLETPEIPISGQHIKDLPPKLERLECSFFDVSLPQVLDLPGALSSLTVYKSGGLESSLLRCSLTLNAWNVLISAFRPFWRAREAGFNGLLVELSLASKKWTHTPDAHHYGEPEFGVDLVKVQSESLTSPTSHVQGSDTTTTEQHDYTCADVERYLVDAGDGSPSIDPRTSRRLSQYL